MAIGDDIRAGGAWVELTVDARGLRTGLQQANQHLSGTSQHVSELNSRFNQLKAAFASITAAIGGGAFVGKIKSMLGEFSQRGDDIAKLSKRTGIAVNVLAELGHAAEMSGADMYSLAFGLRTMMLAIASGKNEFTEIGLAIADLQKMSPDQQFLAVAEQLSRINDEATQFAYAKEFFGRGAFPLLPLIQEGRQGIEALRRDAQKIGVTIDPGAAKNAEDLNDAFTRVSSSLSYLRMAIADSIAPFVSMISNAFSQAVGWVTEFIKNNQELTATIIGIGAAGAGILTLVGVIGTVITVGSMLAPIFMAGLAAIKAVLAAVLPIAAPIAAIGSAVAAAGYLIVQHTEEGRAAFDDLRTHVTTAWEGIQATLSTGDFGSAFQIAVAAIKVAWAELVLWVTRKWNDFKSFVVDGWHDIFAGLRMILVGLYGEVMKFVGRVTNKFVDAITWVLEKIGSTETAQSIKDSLRLDEGHFQRMRQKMEDEIVQGRLQRQKESDAARKASEMEAVNDLQDAAKNLRRLTEDAKARARQNVKAEKEKLSLLPQKMPEQATKKLEVRGTFNADYAGMIGASSLGERIADQTQKIGRDIAVIRRELEEAKVLAFN